MIMTLFPYRYNKIVPLFLFSRSCDNWTNFELIFFIVPKQVHAKSSGQKSWVDFFFQFCFIEVQIYVGIQNLQLSVNPFFSASETCYSWILLLRISGDKLISSVMRRILL